jgi:hypothetical protein
MDTGGSMAAASIQPASNHRSVWTVNARFMGYIKSRMVFQTPGRRTSAS